MTKFKEDEFLAYFFKKDEIVEVNADKLQRYVRKNREKESEVTRLKTLNDFLTIKIKKMEANLKEAELKKDFVYRLDLSA